MTGRSLCGALQAVRAAVSPRRTSSLPCWLLVLWAQSCDGAAPRPDVPPLGSVVHLEATAAQEIAAARARLRAAHGDVSRWVELGRVLDGADLREQSAEVWRGAAALASANAEWPYRAGLAAAAQLDVDAARESLRLALVRDPKFAPAWRALGTLELDLGDTAAARAAFEQVAVLRPTWHDGYTGLALVAVAVDVTERRRAGSRGQRPIEVMRRLEALEPAMRETAQHDVVFCEWIGASDADRVEHAPVGLEAVAQSVVIEVEEADPETRVLAGTQREPHGRGIWRRGHGDCDRRGARALARWGGRALRAAAPGPGPHPDTGSRPLTA